MNKGKIFISIIGTAGRSKDPRHAMRWKHFNWMCAKAKDVIFEYHKQGYKVHLVSGGAAWADHVAVEVAISLSLPLTLHFPCNFSDRFFGGRTASIANYYHEKFNRAMKESWPGGGGDRWNSFRRLVYATNFLGNYTVSKGFHARNKLVAGSNVIVAFTWGEDDQPIDGGTKHTWDIAKKNGARCLHFSLGEV